MQAFFARLEERCLQRLDDHLILVKDRTFATQNEDLRFPGA